MNIYGKIPSDLSDGFQGYFENITHYDYNTQYKHIIFTKGIGVSEFVTLLIKSIIILQNVLKYDQT